MSQTEEDCGCSGSSSKGQTSKPTALTRILNKVFVSEIEKLHRLSLCHACEHFNETFVQCEICGCFLEAKTRLKNFHCALDQIGQQPKW